MVDGVRPTLGEVVVSMDGETVETAERRGHPQHREGDRRRPRPSPSAEPGRDLRRHGPRRAAPARADPPVDRLLLARRRPVADRVRVLRHQHRTGRHRRCDRHHRRVLRLLAPPGSLVGRRPPGVRPVGHVDRRASRGPRSVDGDRRGLARCGVDLALRRFVAPRCAVVGHPPGGRSSPSSSSCWVSRRPCGPGSRLPRWDARACSPSWGRRRCPSIRRASPWSTAPAGGPGSPGARGSTPATPLRVVKIQGLVLEVEPAAEPDGEPPILSGPGR